jgi:hypothetical protein
VAKLYNATYTLTDGKSPVTYHALVNATGGGAKQVATVAWQTGTYGCPASNDPVLPGKPTAGVLYGEITIDAATIGKPYTADFGKFKSTDLFTNIDFYDTGGKLLKGGNAAFKDPNVVIGTVPAKAAFAQFENCGATGGQAAYTAG